jgi:hypothetical protein
MENLFQSVQALQRRLNDAGIPSIVIGGVAVAYGVIRASREMLTSKYSWGVRMRSSYWLRSRLITSRFCLMRAKH